MECCYTSIHRNITLACPAEATHELRDVNRLNPEPTNVYCAAHARLIAEARTVAGDTCTAIPSPLAVLGGKGSVGAIEYRADGVMLSPDDVRLETVRTHRGEPVLMRGKLYFCGVPLNVVCVRQHASDTDDYNLLEIAIKRIEGETFDATPKQMVRFSDVPGDWFVYAI